MLLDLWAKLDKPGAVFADITWVGFTGRAVPERFGRAFEAVTGTVRHLVTLAGSPFVCELFELSDDPHDQSRFARRLAARVLTRDAFVASAEDTIITKLRWVAGANRPKDRDDIRNIIAVQGTALDWAYMERWSAAHGTAQLLAEIAASVPPV